MEDAHIALADIKCNFQDGNSSKINLFAVFDGHGGILYHILLFVFNYNVVININHSAVRHCRQRGRQVRQVEVP